MSDLPSDPPAARRRTVRCPTCGTAVVWGPESPFRPFCSDRCRLIDLGAWANDEYKVESETPPDDGLEPPTH